MRKITLQFPDAENLTVKAIVRGDFAIHMHPDSTDEQGLPLYGLTHVPSGLLIDGRWRSPLYLRPALRLLSTKQWPKDAAEASERPECQLDAMMAIEAAESLFPWYSRRNYTAKRAKLPGAAVPPATVAI